MGFPNTFAALTGPIPTTKLDENFGALLDGASATKGAGIIAYGPSLPYAQESVGAALRAGGVFVNLFASVDATGATNCTTAVQAIIDANKGKRIIFGPGTYYLAGVTLNGSTYNNTTLEMLPGAEIKLVPDGGASTFGGAWIGVLVKDCSGVRLLGLNFDGNRAAMTAREQILCVAFAGASNFEMIGGTIREIRGDGVYISQSNWGASSAVSANGRIVGVRGYNSASDGRNLVTVISADNIEIAEIDSRYVGGVIGGVTMPGGIDVEPDQAYHTCNNIRICDSYVLSAGTSSVAILGKAITNDATADWNTTKCSVKNVTVDLVSGAGVSGAAFVRVSDLEIDIQVRQLSGTRNRTLVIDGAKNVTGRAVVSGGQRGVHLGATLRVDGFDLDITSRDYTEAGIRTNDIRNGRLTGFVWGAVSGGAPFAIQCNNEARAGIVQTNVTYSVDCPFDGVVARAFRNDPGNEVGFSNTWISGCDFHGYASLSVTIDAAVRAGNVIGVTEATSGVTFASGDTTPSVAIPAACYSFNNGTATSVTMFDDGYEALQITVRMGANTTIVHNTSLLRLKGAANVSGRTQDDWMMFRHVSGVWYELSRSW